MPAPTITHIQGDGAFDADIRRAINANFESLLATSGLTVVAPPATAASPGVAGSIAYDSGFLYVCGAPNTWLRTPLSTW